ncbi:MAG: undecaprenyl/decaprenyl-phosphate alpha-N-acetylglucosaminyl 1-phosphate transferase [Deltaproteobacteria bacterium]|nr:undecaprenyl/decaprenyl-phosphate alpha-N-acetylglucosaminyl 1-phosphate transferase [Deltaproteobacteria bacterium]MBI3293465.1 undecaprenyl/decaprenyl-phosphate alpha-N-acetylglucosaminyl 1-phosphate transferase [Deltaproteobacteria bacterium]
MIPTINHWLENVGFAALGMAIAIPLVRLNIRLAPRLGWVDWPKARGLTEHQIPIVGQTLVLITTLAFALLGRVFGVSPWLVTTSLVMAIMGYFDDCKPLPPADKFFVQFFCATSMVLLDPDLHRSLVDAYGAWGAVCGVVFIIGLVNAVNFIDGIDGLAGLVMGAGAIGFLCLTYNGGIMVGYTIYAALLSGALAVFLYFNVIKRQCFIGNIGSYFLSYVLAVMHLSVPVAAPGPLSRLCISGLCFIIPIADSMMVVLLRLSTLRSPFQADKGHLHHRLIQAGLPLRTILFCFGVIESLGLSLALAFSGLSTLHPSTVPILVGLSLVSICTMLVLMLDRTSKRRIETYFRRLDSGEPIYFLKYQVRHVNGRVLSSTTLRRLEARIAAEIRVNDLCYVQHPDSIFVTLQTLPEPLKSISARIENVFLREKVNATLVVDQGEFVKVSYQSAKTRLRRVQ